MTVVEYDGRIVVVDAGLRFPTAEQMGIDLVLPDFTYLRERVDDIEAIVITHGHEDHLGALPWLLRELGETSIPVDLRRPAHRRDGALQARRAQAARGAARGAADRATVVEAGPFEIELVHLTHSIPDALRRRADDASSARCCSPATTSSTRRRSAARRPTCRGWPSSAARGCCCCAATPRTPTGRASRLASRVVGPNLERVFHRCEGRIVVTCFASNIHRVQQVVDAAAQLGRKVALVGRSMRKNVNIGRSLGHIDVPEGMLDPAARGRPIGPTRSS